MLRIYCLPINAIWMNTYNIHGMIIILHPLPCRPRTWIKFRHK